MPLPNRTPASARRLLSMACPILLLFGLVLSSCSIRVSTLPPAASPVATRGDVASPQSSPVPSSPPPEPSATPHPTAVPTVTPTSTPVTPPPTPSQVALNATNTDRYVLENSVLVHPHGLVVIDGSGYAVDGGQLVAISFDEGQATRLMPADGLVEGLPIGELIAPALDPDGQAVLLLDKRGDVYRYDPADGQWTVVRPIDQRRVYPTPALTMVASYNGRTYLLDAGYSQVWRHPFGEGVSEGYLPGDVAPGSRHGTPFDLTRGIDLAVYNDVYVLLREDRLNPAGLARFTGAPAERDAAFAKDLPLEKPSRLYLVPSEDGSLYVIDREGHRLRKLDRETGAVLQTFAFAGESTEIRAVSEQDGRLYVVTQGIVYVYPGTGQTHNVAGGQGPLWSTRPDNLESLASLPSLILPVASARYLPEMDALLPGAPRVYRYGIHQGLDLYGGVVGADVPYGSPILAPADGVVIRAVHDFVEATPSEWDEMMTQCARLHYTPEDILDRLRGRQVWLDHGDGLITRYAHLSGIPQEVVTGAVVAQGDVIGYAGNSGTEDGVAGNDRGTHLHFEIHVNGHYLGTGLSLVEIRRLLQRLFFP